MKMVTEFNSNLDRSFNGNNMSVLGDTNEFTDMFSGVEGSIVKDTATITGTIDVVDKSFSVDASTCDGITCNDMTVDIPVVVSSPIEDLNIINSKKGPSITTGVTVDPVELLLEKLQSLRMAIEKDYINTQVDRFYLFNLFYVTQSRFDKL